MSDTNKNARPRVTVQHFATNDEQTIKRLRAELANAIKQRDEARQEICELVAASDEAITGLEITGNQIAAQRGWDCFREGGCAC